MAGNWKTLPGVRRMRELNAGAPYSYRAIRPTEMQVDIQGNPAKLIAVISSWNDADIIGESVKNCFDQGCSQVFLLDNASEDDSVAVAEAAGATVAEVYETDVYDDDLRIRKMNDIAEYAINGHDNAWILSLDADEFVHGFGRRTILESLAILPNSIRTVGSFCVDLYPVGDSQFVPGCHPGKSMTHGVFRRSNFCDRWHWKHVAIRYLGEFDVAQTRGNHMPAAAGGVREIYEPTGMHLPILHCPYRTKEKAHWRLELLCGGGNKRRSKLDDDVTSSGGAIRRLKHLDNVFSGYWDRVELPHCEMMYGRKITGIIPYPWKNYYGDLEL